MGFKCGIIGLPNVGKSTLFNALTQSNIAEAANYPFATIDPNIGHVPVPDTRLTKLTNMNKSKKTIPTFMEFVDIAGLVKGASKGEGLGNKFLSHIREVDAIAHIVRCFKDEKTTHILSNVDPLRDIEIINTEILLADLETLENKKISLSKKAKSGDKDILNNLDFISKIIRKINEYENIKSCNWNQKEISILKTLNLISLKPIFYVCNVDEKSILLGNVFSDKVLKYANMENNDSVIVSAAVESQIADFHNIEDRTTLLKELGLKETSLTKVIHLGYNLLNLITFFTSGPKETRAWTIKKGSFAPQAGGKIHTDFEKGFIRAETINFLDYVKFNGESGCRDAGKLRQEGKDYIIKDGDILNFLFNV